MEKRKNFMSKVELCKLICYLIDHEYENPQVYSYIKVVSFPYFWCNSEKVTYKREIEVSILDLGNNEYQVSVSMLYMSAEYSGREHISVDKLVSTFDEFINFISMDDKLSNIYTSLMTI